jgi:hypothetical protein
VINMRATNMSRWKREDSGRGREIKGWTKKEIKEIVLGHGVA